MGNQGLGKIDQFVPVYACHCQPVSWRSTLSAALTTNFALYALSLSLQGTGSSDVKMIHYLKNLGHKVNPKRVRRLLRLLGLRLSTLNPTRVEVIQITPKTLI